MDLNDENRRIKHSFIALSVPNRIAWEYPNYPILIGMSIIIVFIIQMFLALGVFTEMQFVENLFTESFTEFGLTKAFIAFLSHSITVSEICPLSMIFQQKYSRIGFRLFLLKNQNLLVKLKKNCNLCKNFEYTKNI